MLLLSLSLSLSPPLYHYLSLLVRGRRDSSSFIQKEMRDGVATISRLLKIIGLFCRIPSVYRALLQKRLIILKSLLIVATPYLSLLVRGRRDPSFFIFEKKRDRDRKRRLPFFCLSILV